MKLIILVLFSIIICSSPYKASSRIVGGYSVKYIDRAPYQVSLRARKTFDHCGGAIISHNFILTAGSITSLQRF